MSHIFNPLEAESRRYLDSVYQRLNGSCDPLSLGEQREICDVLKQGIEFVQGKTEQLLGQQKVLSRIACMEKTAGGRNREAALAARSYLETHSLADDSGRKSAGSEQESFMARYVNAV